MRNLRVMDFCKTHAADRADRYFLEQYRPYVMMMLTRARGQRALKASRPKAGLAILNKGIEEIRQFYHEYDQDEVFASSGEVAILKALAKELESRVPVDPVTDLNEQLARAVEEERYEEAAALRDQLQKVRRHGTSERPDED
jgi:transposase